jgi:hypothetical protein
VKPQPPFVRNASPKTDWSFQHGPSRWDGYSGDEWDFGRHHNLGREYLIESARERAKEMAVFGIILVAAAWPVIYMIVTVVQVLHKAHH